MIEKEQDPVYLLAKVHELQAENEMFRKELDAIKAMIGFEQRDSTEYNIVVSSAQVNNPLSMPKKVSKRVSLEEAKSNIASNNQSSKNAAPTTNIIKQDYNKSKVSQDTKEPQFVNQKSIKKDEVKAINNIVENELNSIIKDNSKDDIKLNGDNAWEMANVNQKF